MYVVLQQHSYSTIDILSNVRATYTPKPNPPKDYAYNLTRYGHGQGRLNYSIHHNNLTEARLRTNKSVQKKTFFYTVLEVHIATYTLIPKIMIIKNTNSL